MVVHCTNGLHKSSLVSMQLLMHGCACELTHAMVLINGMRYVDFETTFSIKSKSGQRVMDHMLQEAREAMAIPRHQRLLTPLAPLNFWKRQPSALHQAVLAGEVDGTKLSNSRKASPPRGRKPTRVEAELSRVAPK